MRADGKAPATNGWTFWKVKDAGGELVEVDVLRRRHLDGGSPAVRTAT